MNRGRRASTSGNEFGFVKREGESSKSSLPARNDNSHRNGAEKGASAHPASARHYSYLIHEKSLKTASIYAEEIQPHPKKTGPASLQVIRSVVRDWITRHL